VSNLELAAKFKVRLALDGSALRYDHWLIDTFLVAIYRVGESSGSTSQTSSDERRGFSED
jgi:hypothetical protein